MYQIRCGEFILYDPRDEELILLNPKCKLEVNTVGEGSFTILSNHPYYDKLKKLKSIFEIRQDNHVIFRGRMTNASRDFHNQLDVDLEGVLAFTNDSIIPPFEFPKDFPDAADADNMVEYFLGWVLDQHNAQVEDWQKLKLGTVTVKDPNNYITRVSNDYDPTWSILKDKLFDSSLGGYLCIRYESDGNYVDYVDKFELTNTQRITFGENLLDITSDSDASETCSAILPIGATIEETITVEGEDYEGMYGDISGGTTSYKVKKTITLEELPDGDLTDDLVKKGKFIYSKSAKDEYGWVCVPPKNSKWDDVTTVDNLKTKAMEYLTGTAMMFAGTITIKALDLSFTDDQIQSFRIYRNILVDSPAHGVTDAIYPLTKLDIDIMNPQNTTITIGDTVRTMIDVNAAQTHNVNAEIISVTANVNKLKENVEQIHVDVGARNLLRKTDPEKWFDEWTTWLSSQITLHDDRWVLVENPYSATSYAVVLPKISTIPAAGRYILSFDAYSDNAVQLDYIYIMKDGGNVALKLLVPITTVAKRYEIPITLTDACTDCNIMIGTKNGISFYVRDIMLSSGNTATDWVPAPEDIDERLDDSIDVVQQTMLEQRTAVMNDCEKIILSALESYVETGNYNEFKETVESQLSVMADEIAVNFTHTTENINNVAGDLQAEITQRKKHITFSENGITIGAGENAMTLELDNDMIKFKKNGVQFGWWDGVDFHTGNIVVDVNERAQFGNFAFIPRSDGSLMFLKVGG